MTRPSRTSSAGACPQVALLHTDGVTQARNQAGEFFGNDRLVEFTNRQAAAGRPATETLRRLNHAILDHQDGDLQDDATTVLIEWLGDQPQRLDLPTPCMDHRAVARGCDPARSPVPHAQQHHADHRHDRPDRDHQVIHEHLVSTSR